LLVRLNNPFLLQYLVFLTPVHRYKSTIRGINVEDDAQISQERKIVDVPTLLVLGDEDYATRAEIAEQSAPKWLRNYSVKKITGCGHWIPLQKTDEYNETILKFVKEVSGQ
jgi:soluble epoxide hydrolase/lipid-phosphate phosphatase